MLPQYTLKAQCTITEVDVFAPKIVQLVLRLKIAALEGNKMCECMSVWLGRQVYVEKIYYITYITCVKKIIITIFINGKRHTSMHINRVKT